MNAEISKKKRWQFFLINVSAFALIFFTLGVIIFQIFNQSAYRETDLSLKQTSQNNRLIDTEISAYQSNTLLMPHNAAPRIPGFNRFNSQIILWSEDGQILNTETLGGRISQLSSLTLAKNSLNNIQTISVNDSVAEETLLFRSITVSAPSNQTGVAFIQIMANVNQIKDAVSNFQTILLLSLIGFWLLSIVLSYYLANLNMKPLLTSWKKQQEFVENASHELRTPLTIIQNSLERLFTKPKHTVLEESESIAQALSETRRLTGLTTDLLMIARGDSQQTILAKEPIRVNDFISQLVKPFQEIAKIENKVFLLENYTTAAVAFDRKKIHQVLVILLDNALKYTNEGNKIVLLSEISGKHWLIEVKNTGPAISEKEKQRIFERFYREDRSRSKVTGGYGLGLAIAKQIVEEHHGQISVRDYLPKGVIFQIKLPLQ